MKVAPVNDAPVITTDTSAVIIPEDEPFSFKGTATDVDGDILQISYEGYPDWLTLEGDSLVGTPLIGGNAKVFYVIASDGLLADTLKLISYVDEVNDAPSISGTDTSVAEDNSISFIKAMFTISDEETIDDDLILTVLSGSKYSLAGNILTPVANYVGDLSVKIEVSDGEKMDTATVKVVVTPVNDAPVLASVTNQSTAENTPLTLTLEMIEESDTDNTLTDASIVIGAGNNYNVSGLTITPTLNYVGDLTVPVSVTDGALSSKTVVMTITVEAAVAIEVVDRSTVVEQFLAYPNPVNLSSGEIFFTLPEELSGTGIVTIFDALGTVLDEQTVYIREGSNIRWDLTNRGGQLVGSGTYVAILRVENFDGSVQMFRTMVGVRQ